MYKLPTSPVFPRLCFLKDVSFGSWSGGKNKTTSLFKLDWDGFDNIIMNRDKEWKAGVLPENIDIDSIIQKFDNHYEKVLQSLRFAIPSNYLISIHETTTLAVTEWTKERRFDTNIREMCLQPAIKFIEVAFRLICDCAYDEETNYFYRAENKYLLPHLLLFRFWQYQTGSGCIFDHANFEKLESILTFRKQHRFEKSCDSKLMEEDFVDAAHITALEKFLRSFQNQVKKIESCHITMQVNPASGPSIGDTQVKAKKKDVFI